MVFSSLSFLTLFLPLTLIAYFIAPRQARNAVLFAVSLVFYAWGEPVYVVLMLFSALSDWAHGLLLEKWDERPRLRCAALISSVSINLGLLGFFKYAGLVVRTLNAALGLSLSVPAVALPIGISFYTFQTMSYTIDVYRRKCPAQRDLLAFGCYVAMFPQLIAGPIVRYVTVADELRSRRESYDSFFQGVCRFVTGLAKKLVLANGAGALWETVSAQGASQLSGELPLSLPIALGIGVLAAVAHHAGRLVPRVSLYPAGGQPRQRSAQSIQPGRRLAGHGPVARRQLEFPVLGRIFRSAADPGKVRIRQSAATAARILQLAVHGAGCAAGLGVVRI